MSKDFTPKQLHEADEYIAKIYGHSLRDTPLTITIDGVKKRIDAAAYTDLYKRFPNLTFLFNLLPTLSYLDNPMNLNILDKIEKELTAHLDDDELKTDTIILQWYFGKLDKQFYYNELNNKLFANWILSNFVIE